MSHTSLNVILTTSEGSGKSTVHSNLGSFEGQPSPAIVCNNIWQNAEGVAARSFFIMKVKMGCNDNIAL